MSLKNIKSNTQDQKGFTIVELLIVVVVIAILAAITIVSYNGITNRANASAAASTAASLQKKAELYAADGPTKLYPASIASLTTSPTVASDTWYVAPSSINALLTSNPDASNGKDTVRYQPCGTGASATPAAGPTTVATITAITGAVITYWGFSGTTTKTISLGQTSGTTGTTTTYNVGCAVS